jgi:uncharacterized protein YodC (DUF2158 family)
MADFKVGDVVKLKSGGAPMTVTNPRTDTGKVECYWFWAADGTFHCQTFPPDALE